MTAPRPGPAAVVGALLVAFAATAGAFQGARLPETNLAVQQQLLKAMAADILSRAGTVPGERIALRADASGEGWIPLQSFAAAIQEAGHIVTLSDSSPAGEGAAVEIRSPSLLVRYTDPMEDGLFGTRRVRRTVSVELSCLVTTLPGGVVRMSETLARSSSDTLGVDAIPGLETAGISGTHGELPQDRFIDRIVEPFVIVGATGVAVFLLFNIRS